MGFQRVTAIGVSANPGTNLGSKFINQTELLLNKYASDANDLLLQPTRTWENHRVTFSRELRREANRIYNVVYANSDVYFWLNYGTSVRYAVLSSDWASKTSVGTLTANSGSGRMVGLSRKAKRGIDARKWTEVVAAKLQPQFTLDMQQLAFAAAQANI